MKYFKFYYGFEEEIKSFPDDASYSDIEICFQDWRDAIADEGYYEVNEDGEVI